MPKFAYGHRLTAFRPIADNFSDGISRDMSPGLDDPRMNTNPPNPDEDNTMERGPPVYDTDVDPRFKRDDDA